MWLYRAFPIAGIKHHDEFLLTPVAEQQQSATCTGQSYCSVGGLTGECCDNQGARVIMCVCSEVSNGWTNAVYPYPLLLILHVQESKLQSHKCNTYVVVSIDMIHMKPMWYVCHVYLSYMQCNAYAYWGYSVCVVWKTTSPKLKWDIGFPPPAWQWVLENVEIAGIDRTGVGGRGRSLQVDMTGKPGISTIATEP